MAHPRIQSRSAACVRRTGHSIMELMTAMIASSVLLAGLGSVMFIAREVAYAPTASADRIEAARVANTLSDDLRYATLLTQRGPRLIEFIVADRDGDNRAERIRYAWSGVAGAPLVKTLNGVTTNVLPSVQQFLIEYTVDDETTTLETTTDTAEVLLLSNATVLNGSEPDITNTRHFAHHLSTAAFLARPGNAIGWNATRIRFYASEAGSDDQTLLVQLRAAGDSTSGPTSQVLGQVAIPETSLNSMQWNTAIFANPVRGLALDRDYAVTWSCRGAGDAARLRITYDVPTPWGVFDSTDGGASWQLARSGGLYGQLYGQLYGTYIVPGPTYTVTRKYVPRVRVTLQTDALTHARVETGIPLANRPELLSAYWRADFLGEPAVDTPAAIDPTAADVNGDNVDDWEMAAAGTFDVNGLADGIWTVAGRLETRPESDFTGVTIVEARCRAGAVVRISADRQSGVPSPITVRLTAQGINAQRLTLEGEASTGVKTLCSIADLPGNLADDKSFIRVRLLILPAQDRVNVQINDEDQGTFVYPTDGPASAERCVSLFGNGAEFDYVDVRVSDGAIVQQL